MENKILPLESTSLPVNFNQHHLPPPPIDLKTHVFLTEPLPVEHCEPIILHTSIDATKINIQTCSDNVETYYNKISENFVNNEPVEIIGEYNSSFQDSNKEVEIPKPELLRDESLAKIEKLVDQFQDLVDQLQKVADKIQQPVELVEPIQKLENKELIEGVQQPIEKLTKTIENFPNVLSETIKNNSMYLTSNSQILDRNDFYSINLMNDDRNKSFAVSKRKIKKTRMNMGFQY